MSNHIKVSVIIPYYNAYTELKLVLHTLNSQKNAPNFEVIVVDDGSYDKLVLNLDNYNFQLVLLQQVNQGRAKARNYGSLKAKGEVLIFLDSDRLVGNDFIINHYNQHESNNSLVCIGDILEFYFSNISERIGEIQKATEENFLPLKKLARRPLYPNTVFKIYDIDGHTRVPAPWITLFSGNLSLRKEVFEKVGRFDEDFNEWGFEHYELGVRLHQNDINYKYLRDTPNYHIAHRREKEFYKNNLQKSNQKLIAKYPADIYVKKLRNFLNGYISLNEFQNYQIRDQDNTFFYKPSFEW